MNETNLIFIEDYFKVIKLGKNPEPHAKSVPEKANYDFLRNSDDHIDDLIRNNYDLPDGFSFNPFL